MVRTIKKILKKIWGIIAWPYRKIKEEIKVRKHMKKLRETDPFIYK